MDATAAAISVSGQWTVQNEMTSRSYSAICASAHEDQIDKQEHNWGLSFSVYPFMVGISSKTVIIMIMIGRLENAI